MLSKRNLRELTLLGFHQATVPLIRVQGKGLLLFPVNLFTIANAIPGEQGSNHSSAKFITLRIITKLMYS